MIRPLIKNIFTGYISCKSHSTDCCSLLPQSSSRESRSSASRGTRNRSFDVSKTNHMWSVSYSQNVSARSVPRASPVLFASPCPHCCGYKKPLGIKSLIAERCLKFSFLAQRLRASKAKTLLSDIIIFLTQADFCSWKTKTNWKPNKSLFDKGWLFWSAQQKGWFTWPWNKH